jgi:hypothetical protein
MDAGAGFIRIRFFDAACHFIGHPKHIDGIKAKSPAF